MDAPPTAGTSSGLNLLAAGFNAHNQLSPTSNRDLFTFAPLHLPEHSVHAERIRILFTNWSSTYILADNTLISLGSHRLTQPLSPQIADALTAAFGDHTALHGCLDSVGSLYGIHAASETLVQQGDDLSPRLRHVAVAGNGKVAVTFVQAAASRLCHILQFESVDDLFAWFHHPATKPAGVERSHFSIPGRPKQMIANAATFLVLMDGGEVFSWGDPRYRSLGRDISNAPPEQPGLVEMLEGLKVVKIDVGGWMSAALVEGGEAYVWGTGQPGTDRTVVMLHVDAGEMAVVHVPDVGEQTTKIVDVGIGDNHLAVVVEGGRLFVCGENANGQLGLGEEAPVFVEDWREVITSGAVRRVVCGSRSTFIFQNPP